MCASVLTVVQEPVEKKEFKTDDTSLQQLKDRIVQREVALSVQIKVYTFTASKNRQTASYYQGFGLFVTRSKTKKVIFSINSAYWFYDFRRFCPT